MQIIWYNHVVDSQTLFWIAEDYRNRGFYLLAADLIKEAIRFSSDGSLTINMKNVLADCLRMVKRWDEAIETYKEVGEYGTIGNINLYLGDYKGAIKWYELVRKRRHYVYYKHPQALLLLGKYIESLDLFCEMHNIKSENTLPTHRLHSKSEAELILLCFQKAYNFMDYINLSSEKTINQGLTDQLNCRIYEVNKLSFSKHKSLLSLVITEFGNLSTAIVSLEIISTNKFFVKAKSKILKIYHNRIWCLQEINDQNLFNPKGLVSKIVNDESFARKKLIEITDEVQSKIKKIPFSNWYDYIQKLNNKSEEINGTDIVNHFNYFLPRLAIVKLFEEEVVEYINNRVKSFRLENNEGLGAYLAKYLAVPGEFYEKSDSIMFNLFSSAGNYLKQTLGLADHNERWINEFAMVKLFYKWFEGFIQHTQASPDWLKPQRLDLFIPELRLAVEYQGEQHFMPIEIFGGEKGFQNRKENDKRKKKLCVANGVDLEYISYNEDMLERIKEIYFKYYPSIKEHKSNTSP